MANGRRLSPSVSRAFRELSRDYALRHGPDLDRPALSGGDPEGLTLEEMMSESLGPIVKEGYMDDVKPDRTLDLPILPSPEHLLPKVKPGANVFGLDLEGRHFQSEVGQLGSDKPRREQEWEPGRSKQLYDKMLPDMEEQIKDFTLRELVLGLLGEGHSVQKLHQEAMKAKSAGKSDKSLGEDLKLLLAISKTLNLIGYTFKGESP